MPDPRKAADTLEAAASNGDGTYDGAKALAWLSDVLSGGKGVPVEEVRTIWADEAEKRLKRFPG